MKDYKEEIRRLGGLNFEVIKEDWSVYKLEDESLLKVKFALVNVFKETTKVETRGYAFSWTNIIGVIAPETLRGPPSLRKHSPHELEEAIIKEDMKFTILKESWSVYKLEDGTNIQIKPVLVEVSRTDKYDGGGMPIYLTNIQPIVKVKKAKKK